MDIISKVESILKTYCVPYLLKCWLMLVLNINYRYYGIIGFYKKMVVWAPPAPKGLSTPLVTPRLQYMSQLSREEPVFSLCLPLFSIHVLYICIPIIKSVHSRPLY